VIVPAYNEAECIGIVIDQVLQQGMEVVIVDDGSADETSVIASKKGAVVLRNEVNLGKGASLIRGFEYVLSRDFDAVITMDGDGQHDPKDIPYFIRLAKYSPGGLFIGNRMQQTKDMPVVRILTNKFMSRLISLVIKQSVPDTQCGFRLIKREVLKKLNLKTSKYETESELIIQAARFKFRIESVPIKTVYRNEKSQINPCLDTLRFIRFISKEKWISKP